jgi:hypothetical protein
MVCELVPVLPQASTTVQVRVIVNWHVLPVTGVSPPVTNVTALLAIVPQFSVTPVTDPKAALICASVGLHGAVPAALNAITGAT